MHGVPVKKMYRKMIFGRICKNEETQIQNWSNVSNVTTKTRAIHKDSEKSQTCGVVFASCRNSPDNGP